MKINQEYNPQNFRGILYESKHLKRALDKADYLDKDLFKNIVKDMSAVSDGKIFDLDVINRKLSLVLNDITGEKQIFVIRRVQGSLKEIEKLYQNVLSEVNSILRHFYPKTEKFKADNEIIDSYEKFPVRYIEEDEEQTVPQKTSNIHQDLEIFDCFRDEELFDTKQDVLSEYYPEYSVDDIPLAERLRPRKSDVFYYNQNNTDTVQDVLEEEIKKPRTEDKKREIPKTFIEYALEHTRKLSVKEAIEIYSLIKKSKVENFEDLTNACIKMFKEKSLYTTMSEVSKALLKKVRFGKTITVFDNDLLEFIKKHPNYRDVVVSKNKLGEEHFNKDSAEKFDETGEIVVAKKEKPKAKVKPKTKINCHTPEEQINKDADLSKRAILVDMNNLEESVFNFMTQHANYVDYVVSKNTQGTYFFDKIGADYMLKLLDTFHDSYFVVKLYEKCQNRICGGKFDGCTFVDEKKAQNILNQCKNFLL